METFLSSVICGQLLTIVAGALGLWLGLRELRRSDKDGGSDAGL